MSDKSRFKTKSAETIRRPQFWQVVLRATQLGIITDTCFFFIFYYLNSPILAWFNIISIAMYATAYYAIKKRNNKFAVKLIFTEALVHVALGVVLIGWGSGFHYFLLLFIPALCLASSRKNALISLTLLFIYYASLSSVDWFMEPIQPINELALNFVHIFNLSVVFAMFCSLSFLYLGAVKQAQRKLHILATTDPLTELYNRRHLSLLADQEVKRAKHSNNAFCILLIDIDHFKSINDNHGHDIGDRVLICVAEILKEQMRSEDIIARWGGEEFLVLLPNVSIEQAKASALRVQQTLRDFDWEAEFGIQMSTTFSAGISYYKETEDLSDAIARADKALYLGKANGRNRVELSPV